MSAEWIPELIPNWIAGEAQAAKSGQTFPKLDPATGAHLGNVARSSADDVRGAVKIARKAQVDWAGVTTVQRGRILLDVAVAMRGRQQEIAAVVARETGKAPKEALGETAGAIQLAEFFAGEGMRSYGRTLPSGVPNKYTMTVRQPLGVAALIIAANTPIANVAWKVFPALICGNTAVLKAAEDTPATAAIFAEIAHEAGLPPGAFNVIQGHGAEAGAALVEEPGVDVISFTGSTAVGRRIAEIAGKQLKRVSLELGGKNPLVVCDDANLDSAVQWTLLSSFSNAGQRCAASSRIVVFDSVYEQFRDRLIEATSRLRIGNTDNDDLGPVINERQLDNMLASIGKAVERGARVWIGGQRLVGGQHKNGYFIAPTVIDGVTVEDVLTDCELFGPITVLYRVGDFGEALRVANASQYGLTAAIHTKNVDRAMQFCQQVRAGVVNVNAGTHGSEPQVAFGGFGLSGNGSREPGVEALDVYSELKCISFVVDTQGV